MDLRSFFYNGSMYVKLFFLDISLINHKVNSKCVSCNVFKYILSYYCKYLWLKQNKEKMKVLWFE